MKLRPRCLVCLVKIEKGKYCPSCRQKIKEQFNKLVKQVWSQAVQAVHIEETLRKK